MITKQIENENAGKETQYRVFVVDDHILFRDGLKGLINNSANAYVVVDEASDGKEFLEKLASTSAQVVLLDIDMPIMNGFEAAERALKIYPDIKIITLSMHGDEDYYFKMVSLGVKGFLLKSSEIDEVFTAISTVVEGGSYFSQELLQGLVESLKTSTTGQTEEHQSTSLSERELEILLFICKGYSNQEIADRLYISKRTVDKHRANILEKTGSKNTANLVVFAIKNHLVEI